MVDLIEVNLPKIESCQLEYPLWRQVFNRLWHPFYMFWLWKIPKLVWRGDDVDVTICFTELGLYSENHPALLWEVEDRLRKLGLQFDTGSGVGGRDWEWDFSLTGPIRIKYRCRHKGGREAPERKLANLRIVK